ncbi:MAG TPA: DNA polymerase IV [Oceanospirillaceae bacterium]|nr:DNA polymerase IV [Oceanospirillaceae bacterium]
MLSPVPVDRKIIHCDCDCFYAAVEMRDQPSYQHRPIAIGGPANSRGVIATCNYPARVFGVHSAMSSAQALRVCPQLLILPGRMALYKSVSAQIMAIFRRYSDRIEPLSLDEAFIDVTESTLCGGSATRIAQRIRAEVEAEVGITISAGVAPNKFIAKVASDWRKPNGLFVVKPDEMDAFSAQLAVNKIPGIGPVSAAKLAAENIYICADLRAFTALELEHKFGRMGQSLALRRFGLDQRPVQTRRIRKSVSVENTYRKDLVKLEDCAQALQPLYEQLMLRWQQLTAQYAVAGVVVKLKFADFTQLTREYATNDIDLDLFQPLLQQAFTSGNAQQQKRGVRLLGLGLKLQTPITQQQLRLF